MAGCGRWKLPVLVPDAGHFQGPIRAKVKTIKPPFTVFLSTDIQVRAGDSRASPQRSKYVFTSFYDKVLYRV